VFGVILNPPRAPGSTVGLASLRLSSAAALRQGPRLHGVDSDCRRTNIFQSDDTRSPPSSGTLRPS